MYIPKRTEDHAMSRFEREWNGELGDFWRKNAHEEAQRLLEQADNIEVEDDWPQSGKQTVLIYRPMW